MELPKSVRIREVGPRDGFQSWKDFISTDQKIEVIDALLNAGVKEIEATSFVSPRAVPQLRDAAELMGRVKRDGAIYAALVPNLKGVELAISSRVDEIVLVISATESHNQANIRRSIDESLNEMDAIFQLAREENVPILGAISVAFGCPYEGDVSEKNVLRIAEAYFNKGARDIILADTTGMATPTRVENLLDIFKEYFDLSHIILHFHNNRGTAMANLLAALIKGVTAFDTALGGIGGCPYVPQAAGNLPTEDVVYMLEDMGINTGIDLLKLIQAAHILEKILGESLPGQVMKSGPRDPGLAKEVCRIGKV